MKKKWYLTPFFVVAACAAMPPAEDAAQSLARAESAFAADSVRTDMRAAFIGHFAREGVFVRDNAWVNTRDYFATRPAPPIVLDWRPAFVVVAQSGDLGLSTGPWKLTSRERPADPPATGEFASVWQRQTGGEWRVIVDIGINHKDAGRWQTPLAAQAAGAGNVRPTIGFVDMEARFTAYSSDLGLRRAYATYGSPAMHLLRQGSAPAVGRDAVLASPALQDDRVEWIVEHGATSLAGDLAFARGRYVTAAAPTRTLGTFMRVWQVERGEWRILLDVTNPR